MRSASILSVCDPVNSITSRKTVKNSLPALVSLIMIVKKNIFIQLDVTTQSNDIHRRVPKTHTKTMQSPLRTCGFFH